MTDQKRIDIWPTIATISLIALLLLAIFSFQGAKNDSRMIRTLSHQRDSLQTLISRQDTLIRQQLTKMNVDSLKIDFYERKNHILQSIADENSKNRAHIYRLCDDDNIALLSTYISPEAGRRR